MAKKPEQKTFVVQATVTSTVTIDVPANSLSEALEKSKAFTAQDFLYDEPGDTIDHEFRITGVYE